MEESGFLKCSCQKCGGHIEFPTDGIGRTIHCPHCGILTTLNSDPRAPKGPPVPVVEKVVNKKSKKGLIISAAVVLVLVAGAVTAVLLTHKPKEEIAVTSPVSPPAPTASPTPAPPTPEAPTNPPPKPPPQKDVTNDFHIGKISLEKTPGSGLVYAVGTIKNTLDRQRFGVKIELNLFNEQDQNIGTVSDYLQVMEPHKEWQFKALLTQPRAVKARFAAIEEQQ